MGLLGALGVLLLSRSLPACAAYTPPGGQTVISVNQVGGGLMAAGRTHQMISPPCVITDQFWTHP